MQFDWGYAVSLLGDSNFWRASWVVVKLSVMAWLTAVAFGFVLALGKQSRNPILKGACSVYIWFFRSLPLLVLLVFVYNLPQIFPSTSALLSNAFYAGLVAMILSETAFIAEIHRGGILSVPRGQIEAGKALGIRYVGIQRLIVIPQAIRVALPALNNQYVTIVKLTSLVSVISLAEILLVGQRLYTQNFLVFETMLAVAFYYVLIVTVFDKVLTWFEARVNIFNKEPRPFQLSADILDRIKAESKRTAVPAFQSDDRVLALELRGVRKKYGEHEVLKGIDLAVQAGEVICIIGPSGSGKTSLIRTINGLEPLTAGSIELYGKPFLKADGTDVAHPGTRIVDIGMVFQSFNLFPHRTVLENVILAPMYHRRDQKKNLRVDALTLLAKVGMLEHAHKYPHQLSGGQQQRVAIARALAMQPSIMLFDEPTSALDPELVAEVLKVMETLVQEGMTMLIVTHEMSFASRAADRILFMEDGRVLHDATAHEIMNSADPRVQDFLRHVEPAENGVEDV